MSYEVELQQNYHQIRQRLSGDSETTVRAINLAEKLQNAQETIFRRLRGIEEELLELDVVKETMREQGARIKALEIRLDEAEKELFFNKKEQSTNCPHFPHISLTDIIKLVCAARHTEPEIVTGPLQTKEVSHTRFIIVYLARTLGKQDKLIGKW